MITSALVSWLHVLGVGLGLGAVLARGALLRSLRAEALSDLLQETRARVLLVDSVWGVSALVLLPTGLFRAFGGLEKGTDFYAHSALFWLKMTLVVVVLALEMWPMATLIKWRIAIAKGAPVDLSRARTFGAISFVQGGALVLIMACAAFMARGFLQVR